MAGKRGMGMKNANVFVDVDLTLVDANGRILPGAAEGLQLAHNLKIAELFKEN
jgi:hypothetical protein